MSRQIISTASAPAAIGPYSQAVRVGNTVYLSGQIPLRPDTMELVSGDRDAEIDQVFANLEAVCTAAGAALQDVVRLTIYLTDMADFSRVNDAMARYFDEPYPARAALGVASLPKGASVEMDAILVIAD